MNVGVKAWPMGMQEMTESMRVTEGLGSSGLEMSTAV